MQIQIKKAVKSGNSSAVVLPRAWLNKEIRVELMRKSKETILNEVLDILRRHIPLEEVIGIYLVGSYARNEETDESDIDILVLTDSVNKELIHEGIYSITIISSKLLNYKIENDLLPIGPMIKEAKPLFNSAYIEQINIKVNKKNVNWYIETTRDKLEIINKAINKLEGVKYIPDVLIYTLVLRIRTLEIIERLINNKKYSKKEFISLINRISGTDAVYKSYVAIKNNVIKSPGVRIESVRKLYSYLENDLNRVKKMIR